MSSPHPYSWVRVNDFAVAVLTEDEKAIALVVYMHFLCIRPVFRHYFIIAMEMACTT